MLEMLIDLKDDLTRMYRCGEIDECAYRHIYAEVSALYQWYKKFPHSKAIALYNAIEAVISR